MLPQCEEPVPDPAKSSLTFGADGAVTAFSLHDTSVFQQTDDNGFYLETLDNSAATKLTHIETDGNKITVSESGGLPRFTFRIDTYPRHVSLHLTEVEPADSLDELRDSRVELRLRTSAAISREELDDLTSDHNGSTNTQVRWETLWASDHSGDHGGVAFYDDSGSDAEHDAGLTSIWVNEDLPRPAGIDCWYAPQVTAWVDAYRAKFAVLDEVLLSAANEEELYALTDSLAIGNNVKRVYLHTGTWKGGREYVPNKFGWVDVNTRVFPKGKEDFIRYSDYLQENGIMLHVHLLSGGQVITPQLANVGSLDPRIASWGKGTLDAAVSAGATTLLFRPEAGVVHPETYGELNHVNAKNDYSYVRLGDELIKVGAFNQVGQEVWQLSGCERGALDTVAVAHADDAETQGVHVIWGRNLTLPYDIGLPNSMMEEYAELYGGFITETGIDHIHFDGPNAFDVYPGARREMQNAVYSYVDTPTTSSSVGQPIKAHFEQNFSGLRDDKRLGYWPVEIGIRPDGAGGDEHRATSWLDTQWAAQETILNGGRRAYLFVPMSGWGVTQEIVDTHGLFDDVLSLFNDWQKLGPALHEDDVAYVQSFMERDPEHRTHWASEDVLVLSKNGSGAYVFTPTHVMAKGTAKWGVDPEKGAVAERQLTTTGSALSLSNPKSSQDLHVVIRVADSESDSLVDPSVNLSAGGSLSVTGSVAPGEYLKYEGGNEAGLYDKNWKLLSNLPVSANSFRAQAGANTITVNNGAGATVDIETQFIVYGAPYVLKTNESL